MLFQGFKYHHYFEIVNCWSTVPAAKERSKRFVMNISLQSSQRFSSPFFFYYGYCLQLWILWIQSQIILQIVSPCPKSISNLKKSIVCTLCLSAIFCRGTKMKTSTTAGSLEIIWHRVDAQYTVYRVLGFFVNKNEILLPSPAAKLSPLVIKSNLLLLEQLRFLNYISFMGWYFCSMTRFRQVGTTASLCPKGHSFIQTWPVKMKGKITF